jgi:glycosyltransferase involved in cell wall biosynthesis
MVNGLVSVLFISMNHEKYVEQGARSVLNQTWKNLEILFVDNHSADRTFEIADEIFRESGIAYKGFRREKSFGISANLNFLLKEAQGEFIAVLSGDDWWEDINLEEKVKLLNSDTSLGLVYGNGYKYFEYEKRQERFFETVQKQGYLFRELLKGNMFFAVSVVSRHRALKDIGCFDETMLIEDWDMYLRMAEKYQIGYLHSATCFSRITGKNLSSNLQFMNKGYGAYFKKYGMHPEMQLARKGIKLGQAYQLASESPGLSSLKYILGNLQLNPSYLKQIIRCLLGMVGFRQRKK